jgi:pyrimidine/purine-5'-nucleotide nucleosidase
MLFAVLRDVVYIANEIVDERPLRPRESQTTSRTRCSTSCAMRACSTCKRAAEPGRLLGRSLDQRLEYEYTKKVGYELGLRGLDVCTGCGPGAMKGPMKGATIGHAKQRITGGRYIGVTEPGIIAAEPPNPIVNQLVIMPDIEKRLEAFVRLAHGIVVFPGGAGTAEEIAVPARHPAGSGEPREPLPVVLTGARRERRLLRAVPAVSSPARWARRRCAPDHHRRRSGGCRALHGRGRSPTVRAQRRT